MAKTIPVRRLNQQTSAVLDEVARGETVVVTRDGRPIARLVPIGQEVDALARLVAEGLVVGPSAPGPFVLPPRTPRSDVDVAAEIARERADSPW